MLCFLITTQLNDLEKSNVNQVKSYMLTYIHYLQLQNHSSFKELFLIVVL